MKFLLFFFAFTAATGDPLQGPPSLSFASLEEVLRHAVPERGAELVPGDSSAGDLVSALGEPRTREDGNFAYALSGSSIDVRAVIREDRLERIQFDPLTLRRPLRLGDLKNVVTIEQIRQARLEDAHAQPSHEQGRSFTVKWNDKGIGLRFIDGPEPLLVGIIRWAPER